MSDSSYSTKTYRAAGGDEFVAAAGGRITIEPNGILAIGTATVTPNGSGVPVIAGVPTADPHVAGGLWANNGVLSISAS